VKSKTQDEAKPKSATSVMVHMQYELLDALEAWRRRHEVEVSRSNAIRMMVRRCEGRGGITIRTMDFDVMINAMRDALRHGAIADPAAAKEVALDTAEVALLERAARGLIRPARQGRPNVKHEGWSGCGARSSRMYSVPKRKTPRTTSGSSSMAHPTRTANAPCVSFNSRKKSATSPARRPR
jgi:hypothetical protein